jgi:hypothetical protein
MNGDQYMNTVKTLNNIAFERKNNKEKRSRKKSSPMRSPRPKSKIKIEDFSLDDRKPNIIINNNINNININISSPYPELPTIKKRPRQNSIDLIFNSYDHFGNTYSHNKHDNEFNQLFETFNNDRLDFENDINTFLQPKKFDFNLD